MDFYHSWFYESILNTEWFVISIVYFIFGANFLAPIMLWFIISNKRIKKSNPHSDIE